MTGGLEQEPPDAPGRGGAKPHRRWGQAGADAAQRRAGETLAAELFDLVFCLAGQPGRAVVRL